MFIISISLFSVASASLVFASLSAVIILFTSLQVASLLDLSPLASASLVASIFLSSSALFAFLSCTSGATYSPGFLFGGAFSSMYVYIYIFIYFFSNLFFFDMFNSFNFYIYRYYILVNIKKVFQIKF